MTKFELVNILVSLLAVVISATAMVRTRKSNEALVELERVHADLSRKQLELIGNDEESRQLANVSIKLINVPPSNYSIKVENLGRASASEVTVEAAHDCEYDPLIKNDYDSKMPYPRLNAGESITLVASVPMSLTKRVFPFNVRWANDDGSIGENRYVVS